MEIEPYDSSPSPDEVGGLWSFNEPFRTVGAVRLGASDELEPTWSPRRRRCDVRHTIHESTESPFPRRSSAFLINNLGTRSRCCEQLRSIKRRKDLALCGLKDAAEDCEKLAAELGTATRDLLRQRVRQERQLNRCQRERPSSASRPTPKLSYSKNAPTSWRRCTIAVGLLFPHLMATAPFCCSGPKIDLCRGIKVWQAARASLHAPRGDHVDGASDCPIESRGDEGRRGTCPSLLFCRVNNKKKRNGADESRRVFIQKKT